MDGARSRKEIFCTSLASLEVNQIEPELLAAEKEHFLRRGMLVRIATQLVAHICHIRHAASFLMLANRAQEVPAF